MEKKEKEPDSLGEALPLEIARVRDRVLPLYDRLGPPGTIGAMLIRADLDEASRATISGDVVAMLRVYETLKDIK